MLLLFITACSPAEQPAPAAAPATDDGSWSKGAVATAANPHAVRAAVEILEKGGHAVEAAIAAHSVLGLVEPQSSGIGGGGFMLVYERESGNLAFFDGRETAPAGATVDMFMRDGEVMGFVDAWQSGKAVGVPGAIALYKAAHDEYGRLPWAEVLEPAIRLATEGFEVSPRLANYLPMMAERSLLDENPGTAEYFYPGGEPLQAGDLLKNPEYAETLTRVAEEGIDAFYGGEIAEAIAAAAQAEPNPGTLTVEDIAGYRAVTREVICGSFRDMNICTPSPPSSGGAQIMIAALYDYLVADAENQQDRVAAWVDAQRLAYADRDHYFGDPDEVDIPLEDLLNPDYLRHRATERFAPGAGTTPGDPDCRVGVLDVAERAVDRASVDAGEEDGEHDGAGQAAGREQEARAFAQGVTEPDVDHRIPTFAGRRSREVGRPKAACACAKVSAASDAVSDSSPARTAAPAISASFLARPGPAQPRALRHSCWPGRHVPPPTLPTIRFGNVTLAYRSPSAVASMIVSPVPHSTTEATSCPVARKSAASTLANCA